LLFYPNPKAIVRVKTPTFSRLIFKNLKIFKMGLLGVPQERIAQRLGMEHQLVSYHLQKTSGLKKLANEQLERGFFANTIADKLG